MSEESQVAEQSVEQPAIIESQPQQPQSFQDLIPDELRMEPSLKDFKDVGSLAKSYVHANKMIGNSIRIPSEDTSDEARQKFYEKLKGIPNVAVLDDVNNVYSKLGVPSSATEYQVEINEDYKDVINPELVGSFKEFALEHKLNNAQVNALIDYQANIIQSSFKEAYTTPEDAEAALRKTWGEDYDNRFAGAQLAAKALSEKYPEDYKKLMTGPLQNNPLLLDLLAERGRGLQEGHGAVQGKTINYGLSPEEAKYKVEELRSDEGFMKAYYNATHPQHKEAVEKMNNLYKKMNPS